MLSTASNEGGLTHQELGEFIHILNSAQCLGNPRLLVGSLCLLIGSMGLFIGSQVVGALAYFSTFFCFHQTP